MDPMDWLENKELLQFFRRHKTEMSCMENPCTFLNQLRDHDMVLEDQYKRVSRMKSKENMKKGLYEILDWLERKRSQDIKAFWSCVFKETILNQYPTLRLLRNSLMDGSFQFEVQLPERVQTEEEEKGKALSEDEEEEEKKANSVKKKRKLCDEEAEQAGPSAQLTPKKKAKKILFSSPLKKGEKSDIWTWPIYKLQLPVTCGLLAGTLSRLRLSKGEKCIFVGRQWFSPSEFESFAGKKSSKNWKLSIRCMNTPLAKLIQEGHLKAATYRGCTQTKKSLFPSDHVTTVSEGEEDEDSDSDSDSDLEVSSSSKESSTAVTDEGGDTEEPTEQQPEASNDGDKKVFKVTCGAVAGTLHRKRFASGNLGKSIRTETSWMSPVEFMKKGSCQTYSSWRKDIKCEGEPISDLIEANILRIHPLLCNCRLCKPDCEDLENQKNDDECFLCKTEKEEELVVCDGCPRSFHKKCHLPHVDDKLLGDKSLWMCTFCVYKTAKDLYGEELERKEAMSRQISQWMLQCHYLLLCLCSADEEQIFTTNPCLYLERYSTVITTSMWIGNVADKLQKQCYQTVGEFVSDIQLIFTNCASYNRGNAEFLAKGNRLKELFDREFKSVFNITELNVN
ncbi:nuclear body protein SP140-like protein [Cottoperca gobio]|uniref:Nuclear body protein SP140-like protein n=1 Tax=Cottoperca gobio TaxID=56716 RepID=A0A6J2QAB6_COTGO|nr:nuclear body protein SP140-like protein [Cottoperca gobio]